MKYTPTFLKDEHYEDFRKRVSAYHDNIIAFASIADLRATGKSNDEIADLTSEAFDTQIWPIRLDPETANDDGPFWETITESWAAKKIVSNLMGGPAFGYRDYRMPPEEAGAIWETFLRFFDNDSRVLYEVNLGDHKKYVFSTGILIFDKDKAGVLNILQND
ncbi:MAG TPA: hypothetical protein VD907_03385 [Verrucomicrobiae bacterium]|nr:hypothetical protein [Verrucomicrobiae bacterium]